MSDPFDPRNPPMIPTPTGEPGPPGTNDPNAGLIGGSMSSQAVSPANAPLSPQMMQILALLGQIMQYKNGAGQLQGIFGGGSYAPPPGPPVPIGYSGPDGSTPSPTPVAGPTAGPTPLPQGIAAPPTGGLQGIFGGGTGAPVGTPDVGTGGGFQEMLARRRRFGG